MVREQNLSLVYQFNFLKMKILVVDDEKDIQSLIEQRFRKAIFSKQVEFVFACNGQEALDYLYQHSNEDVQVLSDINMPVMNGLELLKIIKHDFIEPPKKVMMISAYGDVESHDLALQLGADDFLEKPLNFLDLKEKLKIAS
jgi:CheY-like chemotaxis protein